MPLILTPVEARVIGCLLEKAITTPDQYPLTLNALTNACNQKSSREPVMNLDPGEVEHAIRSLADKHIVRVEENFKSQVSKYTHRFCNTPFSDLQFDTAQYALVCVLLLRGARTPGELRSHCTRMHAFEDNAAVVETLNTLMGNELNIVQELPRKAGRRDSEYIHLFYPEETLAELVDEAKASTPPTTHTPSSATVHPSGPGLAERVTQLEEQVAELTAQLAALSGPVNTDNYQE